MNKRFALFLSLIFLFASCSHTKNISRTNVPKASDLQQLQTQLDSRKPSFSWLRSRSILHFEDPSQKFTANAIMKMRDDSVIWASVNVLLEVARGVATNDSAVILNRTSKEYSVFPVSGLQSLIGIEGLDLKAFQNLLLAIPPFGIKDNAKFEQRENSYYLETTAATYKEDFDIDPATLRMTRYHYQRNNSEQVTVTYSNFIKQGEMELPQKIDFELETPQKILISLDVSEYNLLQADEAPLSIPASYKRVH